MSKEAMKQALEALNKLRDFPGAFDECLAAAKALRLAIAMEPVPVQKPVAWLGRNQIVYFEFEEWMKDCTVPFYTTPAAAQPAKQERPQNCGTGYCSCIECVMEQEQGEPVAEDKVKQLVKQCTHRDVDGNWYVDGVQLVHATCFALDAIMCRNTTPQQRKPLTNEQIAEITVGFYGSAIHHDDYEFARAIEAAHGIKE